VPRWIAACTAIEAVAAMVQGNYKFHQYQVVGRHLPTEAEPAPTVYRMKVWAMDAVRAKSKFW
jgi:large subunit ribosomal protein L18Ae